MPRKKEKVEHGTAEEVKEVEDKKPAKKAQPRKRAPKRKEKVEDGEEAAAEGTPAAKPRAKKVPKASPNGPTSTEPYTAVDGWEVLPPSVLHRSSCSLLRGTKVAAFDLDGTLVTCKSGQEFPGTADDYRFFNPSVVETVQQYQEDGYRVVVFSNQGGIKSAVEGPMATKLKKRAHLIIEELGCPMTVLYATKDDEYRKPKKGMWDFFLQQYNQGLEPDMKKSFFVGDAAGRLGDFSDSDKGFADAVGIPFKTPEQVFGDPVGKKAAPKGKGDTGHNDELVNVFNKLAEVAGGAGGGSATFKVAALKKVAGILSNWPAKLTCGKDIASVQGVGKASVQKIDEFLSTGKLQALEEADVSLDPVAASDKGAGAAFQFA